MKSRSYAEFQRFNHFRPLAWRWERACWSIANTRRFSCQRDDGETKCAVDYLRHLPSGRQVPTDGWYPDISAAHRLRDAGGPAELLVQARLLARQTSIEIARLTGVPADAIDAYEALFFNIRDRLDAHGWILARAIGERSAGQPERDAAFVLKSFAYYGGPLVLEAVLPYLLGGKELFEPPLDLSTPEGRREQAVRLAVAVQLLPQSAKTDKKLHRIMLLMRENERKRVIRRTPAATMAQHFGSSLGEVLVGVHARSASDENADTRKPSSGVLECVA